MQDATLTPQNLSACHELIARLSSELQERDVQLHERDALIEQQVRTMLDIHQSREVLQQDNATLKLTIEKLLQRLYGNRRERFLDNPDQLKLDFGDVQTEEAVRDAVADLQQLADEIESRRTRKGRKRRSSQKFPPHLPRVEKLVDVPEENKLCPVHGEKKLIGYDETETLKMKPPELYVEVSKYPKYACEEASQCGVEQAERPTGLVEGNRFDTSVAAEVIVAKYAYHLPYYRQQDWFARMGWTPSRSTLLNLLAAAVFALEPLAAYYRKRLLGSAVLGCDETRVTLLIPPALPEIDPLNPRSRRIYDVLSAAMEKKKASVEARMWAYRSVDLPINLFDFTVSRHRDGPNEILASYYGKLMGDCWSGFQKIELRSDGRIARGACWAHARRKVFDGRSSHPDQASRLLALIGRLYDIEDRGQLLTEQERLELRRLESLPVLARIRELIDGQSCARVLPKSALGEALGYLRNNWDALLVYASDGLMPIDNNDVEQLMKQVALGRKNWLFVGSVEAGNRAAVLLTLISTAVRNDLDVWAYLKDVLDQLLAGSTDYHALCADVWKQSHPEHVRVYRAEERQAASDTRRLRRAKRRAAKAGVNSTPTSSENSTPVVGA